MEGIPQGKYTKDKAVKKRVYKQVHFSFSTLPHFAISLFPVRIIQMKTGAGANPIPKSSHAKMSICQT